MDLHVFKIIFDPLLSLLLELLLCIGWHILYYPIDLICSFIFVCCPDCAIPIFQSYLIHHSGVLLCNLVSYSLLLDCFLSQKLNYLLLTGSSL